MVPILPLQVKNIEWPKDRLRDNAKKNFAFIEYEDERIVNEIIRTPKQTIGGRLVSACILVVAREQVNVASSATSKKPFLLNLNHQVVEVVATETMEAHTEAEVLVADTAVAVGTVGEDTEVVAVVMVTNTHPITVLRDMTGDTTLTPTLATTEVTIMVLEADMIMAVATEDTAMPTAQV